MPNLFESVLYPEGDLFSEDLANFIYPLGVLTVFAISLNLLRLPPGRRR